MHHHCFFFSSRRRHTRWNCDWSSDVCSSDLGEHVGRSLFFGFGKTKRGFVLAKNPISFVGVPGRMAHFKGKHESGWAESKEILKQGAIELKVRRKLNEDRTEVIAVV